MDIRKLVVAALLIMGLQTQAQKYTTAAGIRVGTDFGITLQQSLYKNYTLEAIVQKGLFSKQTSVTALFEQHNKLFAKALNFYVGAGPHMGFYSTSKTYDDKNPTYTPKNAVGLSLIGGIEVGFKKTLLSFDYKPAFNIVGGTEFINGQAAVSLRYIFLKKMAKKKEEKQQKWKFWKKKED